MHSLSGGYIVEHHRVGDTVRINIYFYRNRRLMKTEALIYSEERLPDEIFQKAICNIFSQC